MSPSYDDPAGQLRSGLTRRYRAMTAQWALQPLALWSLFQRERLAMRLAEIWRRWKPALGDEASFVGIIYLLGLVAVLLLVHLLQPEREESGSSSRSPTHREKSAP